MKLRLSDNSIRLRVSRSEVEQFGRTGRIEQTIEFSSGPRLSYALESSAAAGEPSASFDGDCIRIVVPAHLAREWVQTDRAGIEAGASPQLVIEKDFQCLHKPEELDPDAYPNPLAAPSRD